MQKYRTVRQPFASHGRRGLRIRSAPGSGELVVELNRFALVIPNRSPVISKA